MPENTAQPRGYFHKHPVTHTFTPLPPAAIPLAAATKSGKPTKWEGASGPQGEIYKLLIFIDTSHCLLGDDFKPPDFCPDYNEKVTKV